MTALVGKYFIGVYYDDGMRSGIVEAAIDATHYLVRFDDLIDFADSSKWPPSLVVVPISAMISGGVDEWPPPWRFFDDQEQRARYGDWLNQPPTDPKPRAILLPKSKVRGS
jgi:hypothetical protein